MPGPEAIGSAPAGGFFGVVDGASVSTAGPNQSTETSAEAYQRGVRDGAAFQQRMDADSNKPVEFEGPTPSQVLTVIEGPIGVVKAAVGALIDYVVSPGGRPTEDDAVEQDQSSVREQPDATVPTSDATVNPTNPDGGQPEQQPEEQREEQPENPTDDNPKDGGFPDPDAGGFIGPDDDSACGGIGPRGGPISKINFGSSAFIGRDGFPMLQDGAAVRATISPSGLVHVANVRGLQARP